LNPQKISKGSWRSIFLRQRCRLIDVRAFDNWLFDVILSKKNLTNLAQISKKDGPLQREGHFILKTKKKLAGN